MRRRDFIAVLGSAAALPLAARAQQPVKVHRIGWLGVGSQGMANRPMEAFWQGMRDLGYAEGKEIVMEVRTAEGRLERLPDLAAELLRLDVELIIAVVTPATRAAQAATSKIPIVSFTLGDPVAEGFVASLARPGRNITGLSFLGPDLVPKCLSLLKEGVPEASRTAILWQPGLDPDPKASDSVARAEAAARPLGVELLVVSVPTAMNLVDAFATMAAAQIDALLVLPSVLSFEQRRLIADLAIYHRLPSMFSRRENVDEGGLMSFGANFPDLFRRGAVYVDKILRGGKPTDIPVEQPTKFEFVINLKTAKAVGLEVPATLLASADEVIE